MSNTLHLGWFFCWWLVKLEVFSFSLTFSSTFRGWIISEFRNFTYRPSPPVRVAGQGMTPPSVRGCRWPNKSTTPTRLDTFWGIIPAGGGAGRNFFGGAVTPSNLCNPPKLGNPKYQQPPGDQVAGGGKGRVIVNLSSGIFHLWLAPFFVCVRVAWRGLHFCHVGHFSKTFQTWKIFGPWHRTSSPGGVQLHTRPSTSSSPKGGGGIPS